MQKKYPEQILEKKLFPLTVKKLLRYTQLQLFISNEADKLVSGIVNNSLSWPYKIEEDSKGSNFIAISRIELVQTKHSWPLIRINL